MASNHDFRTKPMKNILCFAAALAAVYLQAQSVQAPVPAAIPVLNEDEIAASYLALVDATSRYLEKATAPNPVKLAELQNDHVAPLRLTIADFRKVEGIARLAKAELEAWNAAAQAARPTNAVQAPAAAAQLQAQKSQLVKSSMNNVKSALPPGAWTTVENFLKTDFLVPRPAKANPAPDTIPRP